MMHITRWSAALLAAGFMSGSVHAALIGVSSVLGTAAAKPDIPAAPKMSYNATTDLLTITGVAGPAVALPGGGSVFPFAGSLSLTATVDGAGNASNVSLSLTESMPGPAATWFRSLPADFLQFGFGDYGGQLTLEFKMKQNTAGASPAMDAQAPLHGATVLMAVHTADLPASGNPFTSSFSNINLTSNTAAEVPEPAIASMIAVAGLALRRRRFNIV
jgi:hypothetical protein